MARIDVSVLKTAIAHVNKRLLEAGSTNTYRYAGRGGFHVVDVYMGDRNLFMVGCGTSKECIGAMYSDAFDRIADKYSDLLSVAGFAAKE